MARIRTIKPSFFRHGELQDLEAANPGKHCMLVFAGLWGHCDRTGVFECDPRQLKLDILPFLPFDMAETIGLLEQSEFLRRYEVNGKQYAVIPSFSDHQRIGGKELTEDLKHPREAEGKQSGSTREATEKKQGRNGEATGKHLPAQEVEGNGVREGKGITTSLAPQGALQEVVEVLPLKGAGQFAVEKSYVVELERAYPIVDVPATLKEIRAWMVSNPDRQKTRRGIRKCVNGWCQRIQEKHGAA